MRSFYVAEDYAVQDDERGDGSELVICLAFGDAVEQIPFEVAQSLTGTLSRSRHRANQRHGLVVVALAREEFH